MIGNPLNVVLILFLAINLILGFLIYFKKKDVIGKFFLGISLSTGMWMAGLIIMALFNQNFWFLGGKIAFAGASLIPLFFLLFSIHFPEHDKLQLKGFTPFLYLIGFIFFLLIVFTDQIISGNVSRVGQFGFTDKFGFLYPFFGIYFITFVLAGCLNFIGKLKKSKSREEKTQIKFFISGAILSIIAGSITNLLLPLLFDVYNYSGLGPFTTIFFIAFTAYAIAKHHLMNIRVILTEVLISLVGLILIIEIITAETILQLLLKTLIFLMFGYMGILLLKSVYKEIERREELEKLDKAKSEFISIASHQLRAPLTIIKGYVSMLVEGSYGKITKESRESLQNVYQSNERLIRLVNDLLDISRIETGKIEMVLKKTSLENMISSVIEEMGPQAKKKNIFLEFQKPQKLLPEIIIDSDKTRQVILNLIDNAVKYTGKGGIVVSVDYQKSAKPTFVRTSAGEGGEKIIIKVKDTGEGIDKEDLPKLFESFSRGRAGSRLFTEGAGLGLYIARKFIELHGGKIWAESEGRGRGSAFYIELPIKSLKK